MTTKPDTYSDKAAHARIDEMATNLTNLAKYVQEGFEKTNAQLQAVAVSVSTQSASQGKIGLPAILGICTAVIAIVAMGGSVLLFTMDSRVKPMEQILAIQTKMVESLSAQIHKWEEDITKLTAAKEEIEAQFKNAGTVANLRHEEDERLIRIVADYVQGRGLNIPPRTVHPSIDKYGRQP